VPRDQEFVRSPFPKHVDTHEGSRYDDSVQPIHSDGFDWMQILQRQAVIARERHVSTYIACTAARLQATYHITLRKLLVFNAH